MKVTMYELLGMIKDDNIPKKIYYLGHYYTWKEIDEDYQKEDGLMLFGNSKINYILNTEVEILEEPKGKPEKLSTWYSIEEKQSLKENCEFANCNFETMYEKINEILDYLESKGESND